MGEGNFSGGGSVSWEIVNTDGESGSGNKGGARGKDRSPKGPEGVFVVTVTGHPPIIARAKGTKVSVVWGDPSNGEVGGTTASRTTGKTSKSKTTK